MVSVSYASFQKRAGVYTTIKRNRKKEDDEGFYYYRNSASNTITLEYKNDEEEDT